jgi:predicted RNA-binding protein with PUA-like domain
MPNHWILKSDAESYGFDQLLRDGRTTWDGVSNPVALKHIRAMAPGDPLLIYHSGAGKELVGLARVVGSPYPDPKRNDPKLTVVDLEVGKRLPKTVPLAAIKADPFFADLPLVRMPRLSVIPVPELQWKKLLVMAGAAG